jgi:tetratricopeptide (TPR) repeat protein
MTGVFNRLGVLLTAAWITASAASFTARGENPERPLPQQLHEDLADGGFDQFTLFEAALIAGGVSDSEQVETLTREFVARCRPHADSIEAAPGGLARVNALLACLHQRFLTGEFQADYSELHRTLADGHFNCVTSTILFRCLCDLYKAPVHAVAARQHLLCRQTGESAGLIETTCPRWRAGADAPVPLAGPVGGQAVREITDGQLLAKVYYNRGVERLELCRYAEAVELLWRAHQYDREDAAAHDNLLAAYNNWALAECDAGRHAGATRLIEQGLRLDPGYPPLQNNDLHVHQQWILSLCAQQRFGEAIGVMDQAHRRRPDVALFDTGRASLYRSWARQELARGNWQAGWDALARGEALSNGPDAVDSVVPTVETVWSGLVRAGQNDLARQLIQQACARYPERHLEIRARCDLPDGES